MTCMSTKIGIQSPQYGKTYASQSVNVSLEVIPGQRAFTPSVLCPSLPFGKAKEKKERKEGRKKLGRSFRSHQPMNEDRGSAS